MSRAFGVSHSRQQARDPAARESSDRDASRDQQQQQQQPAAAAAAAAADADEANEFSFTTTVPHYLCKCCWEINNWTSLPFITGHYLDSPSFFAEECPSIKWCLRFYPHGDCQQFRDWICVFVVLKEVDIEAPYRPIISKAHFKMEGPSDGSGIQVVERRSESLSFAVHGTHGWSVVMRSEFGGVRHLSLQLSVHFSVPSQVTTFVRGIRGELSELLPLDASSSNCSSFGDMIACSATREGGAGGQSTSSPDCVQRLSKLSSDMRQLLESQAGSDVRLLIGDCEFPAHKFVLAARSPVFHAMFTHDCLEKDSASVRIVDAEPRSFRTFLVYLYCGEVPLPELEACGRELLKLADKYAFGELRSLCAQALAKEISETSLYELALLADTYQVPSLLEHCTRFMRDHPEVTMASEEWRELMQYRPALAQQLLVQMTKRHKF